MAQEEAERGSTKMLEQWLGKEASISDVELKSLLKIQQAADVKVVRVFKRGIPRPDVIWGTVQVGLPHVGSVLQQMLGNRDLQMNYEVFPLGIPFPDVALISFTNIPGRGFAG